VPEYVRCRAVPSQSNAYSSDSDWRFMCNGKTFGGTVANHTVAKLEASACSDCVFNSYINSLVFYGPTPVA
jgi:hypothetical protein